MAFSPVHAIAQPMQDSVAVTGAVTMPYACQPCTKRKVRCDKASPICSSCNKSRLDCIYEAPRRRKRKPSNGDVSEKLAQYERVLYQHGLLATDASPQPPQKQLKQAAVPSPSLVGTPAGVMSVPDRVHEHDRLIGTPANDTPGKLLAGPDTSRYIYSSHWHDLGDDEMQRISEDMEDEDQDQYQNQEQPQALGQDELQQHEDTRDQPDSCALSTATTTPRPHDVNLLMDPLMGTPRMQSLERYYPSPREAMILCKAHMENVEPICKILHIPSITSMVKAKSQQLTSLSKADECLLFVIYHCAVFSMTDDECKKKLARPRKIMLDNYYYATRQALINASFLQTTNMSILQSLVLLLLSCRDRYDPHTYWILTGVAVRIGQRMGLHKDGEKLGLPPFEVQMRRRLFYQLLPLDGIASKMSGTGIVTLSMQDAWDTEPPLNINDDQIWPGMTHIPEEQQGATEMSFCLARLSVAKFLVKASQTMRMIEDYNIVESVISEAESEVEERFIRYCDMVNPLHVLTSLLARSAITAMRVRARLSKIRDQTATTAERRELLELSQKIIDTDTAAYAHTSIRKYSWHLKSFFVYGSWDSIIFVLTSLRRPDMLQLSPAEIDAAWSRMEQVYNNHPELFDPKKQTLCIAIGRLSLRAWDANIQPLESCISEPEFISKLRSLPKVNRKPRTGTQEKADLATPLEVLPDYDPNASFGQGLEPGVDMYPDDVDWEYWDRLISDYQAQGG